MSEGGQVHPVDGPFFMRFYADGNVATWPTPVAPVTRGKYKIKNGQLLLSDAPASVPAELRVTDEKLWYWTDEGGCLLHRVKPDLEPGQLPDATGDNLPPS